MPAIFQHYLKKQENGDRSPDNAGSLIERRIAVNQPLIEQRSGCAHGDIHQIRHKGTGNTVTGPDRRDTCHPKCRCENLECVPCELENRQRKQSHVARFGEGCVVTDGICAPIEQAHDQQVQAVPDALRDGCCQAEVNPVARQPADGAQRDETDKDAQGKIGLLMSVSHRHQQQKKHQRRGDAVVNRRNPPGVMQHVHRFSPRKFEKCCKISLRCDLEMEICVPSTTRKSLLIFDT